MFLLILDRMEIKTFYIFWRKDVVGVLDYMYTKIILESKGRFIFWYQLKMVFIIIVFYSLIMYWYTKYVLYCILMLIIWSVYHVLMNALFRICTFGFHQFVKKWWKTNQILTSDRIFYCSWSVETKWAASEGRGRKHRTWDCVWA